MRQLKGDDHTYKGAVPNVIGYDFCCLGSLLLVLTLPLKLSFEHYLFPPEAALSSFRDHLFFSFRVLLEMLLTPSKDVPEAHAEETVPAIGANAP